MQFRIIFTSNNVNHFKICIYYVTHSTDNMIHGMISSLHVWVLISINKADGVWERIHKFNSWIRWLLSV